MYVGRGCSRSALANCTLKGGGGALLIMHWLPFRWRRSASLSLIELIYAPESTNASILTELKSTGRRSILFFFLSATADINGM